MTQSLIVFFFFSSRRRHTSWPRDWSSDVCSSDLEGQTIASFPIDKNKIDLPISIISGQNVYTFISRLTWGVHGIDDFNNFMIPFRAIGTNLETGEAKVFSSGYLPEDRKSVVEGKR